MGGDIGRFLTPRFLPKLPNDDRDEFRLWSDSGVGLDDVRGDLVKLLVVSKRGRGTLAAC